MEIVIDCSNGYEEAISMFSFKIIGKLKKLAFELGKIVWSFENSPFFIIFSTTLRVVHSIPEQAVLRL